jgi:hypothetical protein
LPGDGEHLAIMAQILVNLCAGRRHEFVQGVRLGRLDACAG